MGSCSNRLYQQKITELAKKNCNIEIFPQSVPHEIIMKYTLMADLLFILYDPAIPNNKFASPNKLFEAMRCNKPVLINDQSSMTNIVLRENCGIIVSYGNINQIKEAIFPVKRECKPLSAIRIEWWQGI